MSAFEAGIRVGMEKTAALPRPPLTPKARLTSLREANIQARGKGALLERLRTPKPGVITKAKDMVGGAVTGYKNPRMMTSGLGEAAGRAIKQDVAPSAWKTRITDYLSPQTMKMKAEIGRQASEQMTKDPAVKSIMRRLQTKGPGPSSREMGEVVGGMIRGVKK